MNRFANQKAFLYSCYQDGLCFQQQELGKSEEGTTPGSSANSAITANVLSYQIQVNLYVDYLWKKLNVCK